MDFTKDIYINKEKAYENQDLVILYKGYLFENNLTTNVYLSYGYGNTWENKNEIKMKPSTFGYLATVHIKTGENLQFCFRDDNGNWDNNNQANYILPIYESSEVLSFESLPETSQEVTLESTTQTNTTTENNDTTEEIFNPSVVSSNQVELYKTVDLDNTTKQTIPDNTIITQVNLKYENKNVLTESVIKSETPKNNVSVEFLKLTELAKQHSVKAFDEDKVTAGSVYVNSITKDLQDAPTKINNLDETSLVIREENYLSKVGSFVKLVFEGAKTAVSKLVKLIKTSLRFGHDED